MYAIAQIYAIAQEENNMMQNFEQWFKKNIQDYALFGSGIKAIYLECWEGGRREGLEEAKQKAIK